jgi:Na+-translocating ferredoxin:NAD+ oxidoreductase RnfC subunit
MSSRTQAVGKIKAAGVVGAGGAGFPTHVKVDAEVDTVLVNGAACEPLLESDTYLLEEEIDTFVAGLVTVIECTGAKQGYICLKGKHKKAVSIVKKAVAQDATGRLKLFELGDYYPAGDEHVLVREVTGRTVPEAGIPLNVGVVVCNVETVFNIARAMGEQPVTDRYLTVAGEVGKPMIVRVPVGSLVSEVIAFAGGAKTGDFRVVDGGPMMGRVLKDTDQPVTKTTSGILVLPSEHNVVAGKVMDPEKLRRLTSVVCCQCSWCSDLCPRNLLGHQLRPHMLMRALGKGMEDAEIRKEALLCSECGICEKFACPMKISPREVNMQIKKELGKKGIRWKPSGKELKLHPFRDVRMVPTSRLIQRLDVARYDSHPQISEREFRPSVVRIPLQQHIGAPAVATVSDGAYVRKGDLVGEIPAGSLGARVHASIEGTVESVLNGFVIIKAD